MIASILDPWVIWGFYRDRKRSPAVYSRSGAGFPFDIIYDMLDSEIIIVAHAHERRRPGYKSPRLTD